MTSTMIFPPCLSQPGTKPRDSLLSSSSLWKHHYASCLKSVRGPKCPELAVEASTYSHPFAVHQSTDVQIWARRRRACFQKHVVPHGASVVFPQWEYRHFWIIYTTLCNVIMFRVWSWGAWNESECVRDAPFINRVDSLHIWSNSDWSRTRKRNSCCCKSLFCLKWHHVSSAYCSRFLTWLNEGWSLSALLLTA